MFKKILLAIAVLMGMSINVFASLERTLSSEQSFSISSELKDIKLTDQSKTARDTINEQMLGINPAQFKQKLVLKYSVKTSKR